ncbi:MAG: hypothetical protein V1788_01820 [Nanoarchaeota archaeon]
MRESIKKGFGFGLTSGIITTLGLMVGLQASTDSKLAVIGGIIIIAIADALSDSLGMHISEEFNEKNSQKKVWESTLSTFLSKFIFAISFIIPVLIFNLSMAIIISIIWGLFLISIFSFYISKTNHYNPIKIVTEHLLIAIFVIIVTHYLGLFVKAYFG